MNEQVDQVIINGFPYLIDRKEEVLLPRETPRPAISFHALKQEYGFYKVTINPDGDIVPQQEKFFPIDISIPSQLIDATMVMNEMGRAAFNRLSYEEDWGILLYDKQISERLAG